MEIMTDGNHDKWIAEQLEIMTDGQQNRWKS